MRYTLLSLFLLIGHISFFAQGIDEVSTGQGYGKQAFYQLSSGAVQQLNLDSWDLAFTAFGPADAGIHINESSTSISGVPATEVAIYLSAANDFGQFTLDDTIAMQRLYNPGDSWNHGALNEPADPFNASDFGWGVYQPAQSKIVGNRVFVIKTRSDAYIKLVVDEMTATGYSGRFANVDGTGLQTFSFNKADAAGAPFLLLKLSDNTVVPSPKNWDLLFGRYSTTLDAGGVLLPYNVTGVLLGPGVQAARADGVDPFTVDPEPYKDSLRYHLEVIGSDWKAFDFTSGWVLADDRAYFVKTTDNHFWKIIFLNFEGSTTGTTVLEKTDLGVLSAVTGPGAGGVKTLLYPNPMTDLLHIALEAPLGFEGPAQIQLIDMQGRMALETNTSLHRGLQVIQAGTSQLASGAYVVRIVCRKGMLTLGQVFKN